MTAAEQYLVSTKDTVRGAFNDGERLGERLGYVRGWRWGVVCGAALAAAVLILAKTAGLL